MQLCRYYMPPMGPRVGAVIDGEVYDITEAEPGRHRTLSSLLGRAAGFEPGEFTKWVEARVGDQVSVATLAALDQRPDHRTPHLLAPIDTQEVWAAGVTYLRSVEAREAESRQSGVYDRVRRRPARTVLQGQRPPRRRAAHVDPRARRLAVECTGAGTRDGDGLTRECGGLHSRQRCQRPRHRGG